MSKVTAPLLSFGAGGQVGKSMVFSKWRGIPYVRRHVTPANPRTTAQTVTRSTFALLREMWKLAPAVLTAPWNAFAEGRPFTGMNKFVGENLRVLRNQPDFANFIGSPGARGGLPPVTVDVPGGDATGVLTVDMISPAAPDGWTLVGGAGVAFPDQDPAGIFTDTITAVEAAGADPSIVFTGFTAAQDVAFAVWLIWTKPDGKAAYSVSSSGVAAAGA